MSEEDYAMQQQIEELTEVAACFRDAIERCDVSQLPVTFENFPFGSCGDAVLLLGTYLRKNGHGDFYYMSAESGDASKNTYCTHAWLEKDGLIIDITADQFRDTGDKVIVSTDRTWHDLWNWKVEHVADIGRYDYYPTSTLEDAYQTIIGQM